MNLMQEFTDIIHKLACIGNHRKDWGYPYDLKRHHPRSPWMFPDPLSYSTTLGPFFLANQRLQYLVSHCLKVLWG